MMSWSDTPEYTAIDVLSRLWNEPAWRASDSAGRIESVLRAKPLPDQDDVVRVTRSRSGFAGGGRARVRHGASACRVPDEVPPSCSRSWDSSGTNDPRTVEQEVVRTLAGGEPSATLSAQSDRDSDLVECFRRDHVARLVPGTSPSDTGGELPGAEMDGRTHRNRSVPSRGRPASRLAPPPGRRAAESVRAAGCRCQQADHAARVRQDQG